MSPIGGVHEHGNLQAALAQQQLSIAALNKVQSSQEQQGQAIAQLLDSVPDASSDGDGDDQGRLDVRA